MQQGWIEELPANDAPRQLVHPPAMLQKAQAGDQGACVPPQAVSRQGPLLRPCDLSQASSSKHIHGTCLNISGCLTTFKHHAT